MPTVTVWQYVWNAAADAIPPKGTHYHAYGPDPRINNKAVTVTAFGLDGVVSGPQFLEVVQTATRAGPAPNEFWLDIVTRNNTDRRCPMFRESVSLIAP